MKLLFCLLPLLLSNLCIAQDDTSTWQPPTLDDYEKGEPGKDTEPITELPNGQLNLETESSETTVEDSTQTDEDDEDVVTVEDGEEDVTVTVDKEGVKEKFDDAKQEVKDFAKSDTGLWVGIGLAALFTLGFVLCCVSCFLRRRRPRKEGEEEYVEEDEENQVSYESKTVTKTEPEPSQWTDPAVYTNPSPDKKSEEGSSSS